jgi:hypothetical protein
VGWLGVRDCVSMYLYGEGESLSLTYFPGPSTSKVRIEIVYNSPNKRWYSPPTDPTVVSIARKGNMESGRGMLAL